jgi:3-hydroxybutyryl-CoA dehydratase
MNVLNLVDIKEGGKVEIKVHVGADAIDSFAELSGDFSAIHLDDEFARSKGYRSRIAHGVLLGSYISRLIGMYLPGKNGVLQSLSLNFRNPIYADSDVRIVANVERVFISVDLVSIKFEVYVEDELKATAEAKVVVR